MKRSAETVCRIVNPDPASAWAAGSVTGAVTGAVAGWGVGRVDAAVDWGRFRAVATVSGKAGPGTRAHPPISIDHASSAMAAGPLVNICFKGDRMRRARVDPEHDNVASGRIDGDGTV